MSDDNKSARERFIICVRAAGGAKITAGRLGCTRSYVDMIRLGQRRPGMRVAFAIEREFGIKMQDWVVTPTTTGSAA